MVSYLIAISLYLRLHIDSSTFACCILTNSSKTTVGRSFSSQYRTDGSRNPSTPNARWNWT